MGETIVEEVGLAKNISVLRKALGERLGEHRFIVTVPGRGYRFVADVSLVPLNGGTNDVAHGDVVVETHSIARIATEETIEPTTGVAEVLEGSIEARQLGPGPRRWIRRPAVLVGLGLTCAVLLAVGTAFSTLVFRTPPPALTDRDTILLADFVNRTGDPIFDDNLEQGLAAHLEQSPFFSLFPEPSVRQRLRLIGRPPEEGVTKDAALAICRREGLKVFVAGAIASLGSHYAITLEAIDHNGEVVVREQVEADGREQVLTALAGAARRLRERLGESLGSIARFHGELTTSSLEAMKAKLQATALSNRGRSRDAIPFYEEAIRLDPHFATAYMELGLTYSNLRQRERATKALERAFALRDRTGEWEGLRIEQFYYLLGTGEVDKAIDTLERQRRTYPRDPLPYAGLAVAYNRVGESEKALAASREAIQRSPNLGAGPYTHFVIGLLCLNRYDEARQVLDRALRELRYDSDPLWRLSYSEAFMRGDASRMDTIAAKASDSARFSRQAHSAAFAGQERRAETLWQRAIDSSTRSESGGPTARVIGQPALRAAIFGHCPQAKAFAERTRAFEYSEPELWQTGIALALCGGADGAQATIETMVRPYPKDTVINGLWRPVIRAAVALRGGDPAAAIALLEGTARFEAAAEFWPQYLRGLAYLQLHQPRDAARQFRKILDARGQAPMSVLYPLAHLGHARAMAAAGDAAQARQSYQDFFALWKHADADLPILVEAKKEANGR